MKYEEVLKYWGKDKLEQNNPGCDVVLDSVYVGIETDPGYQCCGPNDWDNGCYCSMAESAHSYIEITGKTEAGTYLSKHERYLELSQLIIELDQTAEGKKVS